MHSSISSSDHLRRVPGARWGATWVLALTVAVLSVTALERHVRSLGYRASVIDDPLLWAQHRARVSNGRPDTIALLGASRIQLGVSTRRLRTLLPGREIVQLAVDGSDPVATLRDLAGDESFRGIVICSMLEGQFRRATWDTQQQYVDRYHRRWQSPGAMLNRYLATWAQQRLTILTAGGRRMIAGLLWRRRFPPPIYVRTNPDRSRDADYSLRNIERERESQRRRIARLSQRKRAPEPWLREALEVEPYVAAIQRRGGRVVFLRMPTCHEHWAFTERTMPKAEFWDRFAAATEATAIHFRDYPSLSRFDCPDSSHLDQRDAPAFTSALVDVLVEKGVLAPRP